MENGKAAVVNGMAGGHGIGSTEFHVLRPSPGLNARFLRYFFTQREFRSQARQHMTGTAGQLRVPARYLAEVRIPVPPIGTQERIVAFLDQQISRVEGATSDLEQARTKLRRLRASVLAAAVLGQLGGSVREHDDELPSGWRWATVGELAREVRYGTSAKTLHDTVGVPVLRMGNIVNGGLVLDDLKFLPQDHPEFPGLLLKDGDLLFNRTNSAELVGKTAVYHGVASHYSFASYLIRVRTGEELMPDYLAAVLNSDYGRRWVRSVVSQQVGQANVSGSKLKAMKFPLPPILDQERIVSEADRHLSLADKLTRDIETALWRASALRERILRAAFNAPSEWLGEIA